MTRAERVTDEWVQNEQQKALKAKMVRPSSPSGIMIFFSSLLDPRLITVSFHPLSTPLFLTPSLSSFSLPSPVSPLLFLLLLSLPPISFTKAVNSTINFSHLPLILGEECASLSFRSAGGGKEEEDRPQVTAGPGRDAERTSHFEERGQQEKG